MKIFKFFVGRGRKVQAVFLPLVLLRGHKGVEKPETKRRPKAGGRRSPVREDWRRRVFNFRRGLGKHV